VIIEYIFEWSFPSVEAMYPRQLGSLGNLYRHTSECWSQPWQLGKPEAFFFAPKPDPLKALPSTVGFFHVGSTSDSSFSYPEKKNLKISGKEHPIKSTIT